MYLNNIDKERIARFISYTRITVCTVCVLQGGVKAVIWTDVVQAFVMVSSVCTVLACAVMRVGGVAEVVERTIAGDRLAVPP